MELTKKLDTVKALIDDNLHNAKSWLELAEEFFSKLVTLSSTYEITEDDDKRRMLALIGYNWVLSNKKVVFSPRKPYDLLLKIDQKSTWRAVTLGIWNYFQTTDAEQLSLSLLHHGLSL